jgi:hypothetical protein
MKTTFDIVAELYSVINVASVTDLLDGGIHRSKRPERSEKKKGIVIVPLPVYQGNQVVNDGVVNINIYAPPLSNNMVDIVTLKEITEAVMTVIEAYDNTTNYWLFEIDSHELITDERDETFSNLRVNYYVEK